MISSLSAIYHRIIHLGIDRKTPSHLIERIIFSNWTCLIGTAINLIGAQTNIQRHYDLLLLLNCIYQIAIFLCLYFNYKHRYLTARLALLTIIGATLTFACLAQGPVVQMEHFFLGFAALSVNMFHASEKRYSLLFSILAGCLFFIFVNSPHALLNISWAQAHYTEADLRTNQVSYIAFFILALIGITNSYARALRLIDEQRTKLFEQNRLSAVGMVASSIAHEINSPLMAMDIEIYNLKTNLINPSPVEQTAVQNLGKLIRRISSIVRGFKLLSHADANDPVVELKLKDLMQPALDISYGRMKPFSVDFSMNLHDPELRLKCQVVGLSQVILNLLNNAVDAVAEIEPAKRWIRLETARQDKKLLISLTDGGNSMSADVRQKLFEPFYTTKPIGKGTGLGLAVSKRTVESHGGSLKLDTESVHTKFIVELPL